MRNSANLMPQLSSAQLLPVSIQAHARTHAHSACEPKPENQSPTAPIAPCVMCCRLENIFFSLSCLPTVRAIGSNKVHTHTFQRKNFGVDSLCEKERGRETEQNNAQNLTKIYKTRSKTIKTTQFIENRRRRRRRPRIMSICLMWNFVVWSN